ncbi:hypothetical protein [Halalkalibacterium halodurans]|nr:hypothetical protein [Halalkalibacterium halodurans]
MEKVRIIDEASTTIVDPCILVCLEKQSSRLKVEEEITLQMLKDTKMRRKERKFMSKKSLTVALFFGLVVVLIGCTQTEESWQESALFTSGSYTMIGE